MPRRNWLSVLAAGLQRMASRTITDPVGLRRVLADIRARDYCVSVDEMTDGASSVAALVRDTAGVGDCSDLGRRPNREP